MKEIMAVIRPNMTNATKDALEAAGFPAYTCTKVRGNHTGTPGDGKIFVMPIFESYQVRNGEGGADAY